MASLTEQAPGARVPAELQRELRLIAVSGAGLLAVCAPLLLVVGEPLTMARWLSGSLAAWVFVVWQCHKRLHLNHSPVEGDGFSRLGWANRITLLRGLLIGATAGFLVILPIDGPPVLRYLPATLYTLAALLDGLDGYIARRQQQTTRLGGELDTALDAFGLLIAPLLAVFTGKLPLIYLLVSLAYYLFQWGIRWRQRRDRPVYPLPPSQLRRYLAGAQMVLVALALWPPLPGAVSQALGIVLMIPLLLGFGRDWLHVSGRLGPGRASAS